MFSAWIVDTKADGDGMGTNTFILTLELALFALRLLAPNVLTWLPVLADGLVNKDWGWGVPVGPL